MTTIIITADGYARMKDLKELVVNGQRYLVAKGTKVVVAEVELPNSLHAYLTARTITCHDNRNG